jgi:hypothetical protein
MTVDERGSASRSVAEAQFREKERALDAALQSSRPVLAELKLSLEDRSVRSYHYKADRLSWNQSLERKWDADLETVHVRVWLTYMEPVVAGDADRVSVLTRVERYRQGGESVLDERSERAIPFRERLDSGIGPTVARELERAVALAGQKL